MVCYKKTRFGQSVSQSEPRVETHGHELQAPERGYSLLQSCGMRLKLRGSWRGRGCGLLFVASVMTHDVEMAVVVKPQM